MQHPVSVNMRIKLVGKRFLGRLFCVVDLYIEGFVDHISCFFDGTELIGFQHLCGDVSDGSCLARACVDLFVGALAVSSLRYPALEPPPTIWMRL